MLRDDRADLRDRHREGPLLFPAYEDYCFANVPSTATSILGLDAGRTLPDDALDGVDTDVEHVVLVLLDGFGFERWKDVHDDHEFLRRLTDRGTVSPLTSIYPSETAAAITTVHTGTLPAEHGVIGWDVYLRETDEVVETFAWEPNGDPDADGATERAAIFDEPTLYARLGNVGVASHVYQPTETIAGGYADLSLDGATRHPSDNVPGMALALRRELENADGPSYHYAYLPHIDAMAHRYGTTSEEYLAQLSMIEACLRRELIEELEPRTAAETLLLVTADHGLLDTDPAAYVDLLQCTAVRDNLRSDGEGRPIPPVGGPRNAHLHLREGTAGTVAAALREEYGARVFTREDAIDRALFGDLGPSNRFERRCGDLIVTHRSRSLYHGADEGYIGRHGGLHPDEMFVPVGAATLDVL